MTADAGAGAGGGASDTPAPLTVAVTGPTGDVGRSLLRVLERDPGVGRIAAMARGAFDPAAQGLTKTEYHQADVLDADAVREVIAGADVVVHLAFMIMGGARETTRINLNGSRNVFRAAIDARVSRLVYASSVAAYGFRADNPPVLTEEIEPRGTTRHYYSAQKAALEHSLRELLAGSNVETYVFRPCIVAGPDAITLIQTIPYVQLTEKMPSAVRRALELLPALKPVIPDPGVPFQLVHHDDVATALQAGIVGRGEPGVYNLAGDGTLTLGDLADALGWHSVPVPELAVDAAAEVIARLPFVPNRAQWIESIRRAVIMDTGRARTQLGWEPRHTTRETLEQTVRAAREKRLIR